MGTRVRALADWLFEPTRSRVDVAIAVVATALIAAPTGVLLFHLIERRPR